MSAKKKTSTKKLKVALVCDWLTNVGGAEKVLLELHGLFPEAPIYTSKYDRDGISWFKDAEIRTGWLQIFPTGMRRILGPLRQIWFSHLDLSDYDVVISVTGAEAKAVKTRNKKTGKKAIHISYCHVPTQYYWQMYDEYMKDPGFGKLNPVVRAIFRVAVKPLRAADYKAAKRVDKFVTISEYARELMRKYYDRESEIIHPPVDTIDFSIKVLKSQGRGNTQVVENYYIVTSRQVNWKRLDIAVEACKELGRELVVVGEGPEHNSLVKLAKNVPSVRFLPLIEKKELAEILGRAKGYLFPSLEPFGIAPVEALSAGCPVIALGRGGALDYVKDGKNGVLFKEQTVESLKKAIVRFEKMKFEREKVSESAKKFAAKRFDKEICRVIDEVGRKN